MGFGSNSQHLRIRFAPQVPILPDKMRGKQRNVFTAFGKRRYLQWKNIQAVKQILPERSFFDFLPKIPVGSGNDPHIHLDDSVSTEPLDFSLLKDPQKIRLHIERKLTNFVKENRATIRLFEESFAESNGAGEGALFMAEQLTLQQAFTECTAIHHKISFICAGAIPVNGICDVLFAGPTRADDQNRPLARPDPAEYAIDLPHRLTLANHVVFSVKEFVQTPVFTFQPCDISRVFQSQGRRGGDGFEQLHVGARKPFGTGFRHGDRSEEQT